MNFVREKPERRNPVPGGCHVGDTPVGGPGRCGSLVILKKQHLRKLTLII
jgi:hypothetical protein